MKRVFFILVITTQCAFAQVGINTTNPTKDLDINGELRIRNLPSMNNSLDVLTADVNGNTGKISNLKFLKEVYFDEATSNIDRTIYTDGQSTVNNVNLGLSNTVVIPAYVKATIIVSYSIPVGLSGADDVVNGYYGIRFLKNGVEQQSGSRKYSIPDRYKRYYYSTDTFSMVSAGTTYIEVIDNSANPNSQSVTFSLNGYIEQGHASTSTVEYRFNMWSNSGNNYNWGKGYISSQLYIHQ